MWLNGHTESDKSLLLWRDSVELIGANRIDLGASLDSRRLLNKMLGSSNIGVPDIANSGENWKVMLITCTAHGIGRASAEMLKTEDIIVRLLQIVERTLTRILRQFRIG